MSSTTFQISGFGVVVEVTVEEVVGDGGYTDLVFTYEIVSNKIADIRGVFFHMNEALVDDLQLISGADVTDYQFDVNNVVDLGNGSNMQGVPEAPFDVGIEIGTPGASPDDIQMTTFTLSIDGADLTLADLEGMDFGIRLNSVGTPNSPRDGSLKLVGEMPMLPHGAQPITLVVEEEDAGLGLGGNEDETSSPDEDEDSDPNFDITTETAQGTLTFTAGTLALTSFVFSDVTGLVTETDGVAGQDLYWVRESDIQIIGYLDAGHTMAAVQIDLNAPGNIPGLSSGDVTVTVTLLDNLLHVDPNTNVEEVLNLGTVKVLASDGSNTVEGVVTIHEIDDVPVADIQDGGGTVTIDETAGLQDGPSPTDDDRGAGADPDNDDVLGTATLNGTALTTVFGGVSNPGSDTGFTQYALSSSALVDISGSSVGADSEGATTVISLAIVDADSELTTTDGKEIKLFLENGLIVGRYDDTTGLLADVDSSDPAAFAIAIGQDGNVAVVQYVSLTNPTSPNNYDEPVDLTGKVNAVVTLTDSDGDEATQSTGIGDQIFFQDDGPKAVIADAGGTVTIDETAGLQDGPSPTDDDRGAGADPDNDDVLGTATLNGTALTTVFGGVSNPGSDTGFTQYALSATALVTTTGSDAGADDEGATTVISLAIVDADSELTTTDGKEIKLFLENGLIVGRYDDTTGLLADVDSGDPAAFAIAIGQDGNVAVVQYVSLTNPTSPNNYDEPVDLTGKVNAVVTVTDGDLDVATQSTGIGDQIFFQDDGPKAAIADAGGSVTIDETAGLQDGPSPTDDDRGAGADPDNDDVLGTATLNGTALTTVFGGVSSPGSDTGFTQYALSSSALVTTTGSDAGADDEGATTVISLAIVDADSELTTTDGKEIKLFLENGLIVGRYDDATGLLANVDSGDPAAFAIAIGQDGNVAIAQYVSLANPTFPNNFDESVDLAGKVNAVVTVTDGDLDVATQSTGIGDQIFFQDDGPLLSGVDDSTNSLVFADGTTATDAYDFDVGADDEGAPGITLEGYTDPDDAGDLASSGLGALEALLGDITAVQSGNTVTYYTPDGSDAGTDPDPLFALTVDDDGWSFEIFQDAPIVFNAINFQPFVSGGPVETITVLSGSGTTAVFDGWLFSGDDGRVITDPHNPGNASTDDDLNPDNIGFGVRGGQASNINNNEGFGITFYDGVTPKTVQGLQFSMDQQGNTDDVAVAFQLTNSGGSNPTLTSFDGASGQTVDVQEVGDGEFYLYTTLPSGNNDIIVTILPDSLDGTYVKQSNEIVIYIDGDFDDSLFKMTYPQDDNDLGDPDTFFTDTPFENDSVRIKDVSLVEVPPIPDVTLSFDIQGTDGDGDQTQLDSFDVFITDDGGAIV